MKLKLEIETFLYGVGFLSNYILFIVIISYVSNTLEIWIFYALPLISLFYTYAAMLKNTDQGINKFILFLMMITLIFSAIGFIMYFEILKQNYDLFTNFILPILFGLYAGHYAVYRTFWISLRNVAWLPFLTIFIGSAIVLLPLIFFPESINNSLNYSFILYFTFLIGFSFAVSCFAGILCKHFKKIMKKRR